VKIRLFFYRKYIIGENLRTEP